MLGLCVDDSKCLCVIYHFWLGHNGKLLTIDDVGAMFEGTSLFPSRAHPWISYV